MDKIYLYDGDDVEKVLESVKSAVLSFSSEPMKSSVMTKIASDRESGISQIKRWISTSSFRLILIEDLSLAFKDKDITSFMLWLKDHAEDFDGPFIIIREKESLDGVLKIAKRVDSIDSLLLNIR